MLLMSSELCPQTLRLRKLNVLTDKVNSSPVTLEEQIGFSSSFNHHLTPGAQLHKCLLCFTSKGTFFFFYFPKNVHFCRCELKHADIILLSHITVSCYFSIM